MTLPTKAALVAALLIVPFAAEAQAPQPQPGSWKITTSSKLAAGTPRTNVQTVCITAQAAQNPATAFTQDESASRPDCKRNTGTDGTAVTWDFSCQGKNLDMSGKGTLNFDSPTHYTATVTISGTMNNRPMQVARTVEGQRVGDCKK